MIVRVKNLNKSFRHPWNLQMIPVLKNVSFELERKSIVGFLGANGSGKTTTIKCMLGLLSYQSGDIQIFDHDHQSHHARREVGYLPERPFFYNYLTAYEFLKFYGQLSTKMTSKELDLRIQYLLELVGLKHAKDMYLKQFSKGMLQRVGMGQALIHKPKLLILDEPLSGLDPDGRRQLANVIQSAFDEGTTIFFSSHLLDDVDRLCQKLVVIKDGVVHFCGEKAEFAKQKSRGFQIQYQLEGKTFTDTLESLELLQNEIDKLRLKKATILSIDPERMNLDQAFKNFQAEAQS